MDRRGFLKGMAMGCTTAAVPLVSANTETSYVSAAVPMYRFFTKEEALTAGAICEQIVPRDEYPGAQESGVINFVDGVLSGPMGRFYKVQYRKGLAMVEKLSRERHGKSFVALGWDDQTSILRDFESGAAAGAPGKKFFAQILMHTMEGYYGDPSGGGNRGAASWKMISFRGTV